MKLFVVITTIYIDTSSCYTILSLAYSRPSGPNKRDSYLTVTHFSAIFRSFRQQIIAHAIREININPTGSGKIHVRRPAHRPISNSARYPYAAVEFTTTFAYEYFAGRDRAENFAFAVAPVYSTIIFITVQALYYIYLRYESPIYMYVPTSETS